MYINQVTVLGNLGKDPSLRVFPNGNKKAELSVCTNHTWKDETGQKHSIQEWHDVAAWNKRAENCVKYLHCGDQIYVRGRIETRKWTDKDGIVHYRKEIRADEIQFGSKAQPKAPATNGTAAPATPATQPQKQSVTAHEQPALAEDVMTDDIPF